MKLYVAKKIQMGESLSIQRISRFMVVSISLSAFRCADVPSQGDNAEHRRYHDCRQVRPMRSRVNHGHMLCRGTNISPSTVYDCCSSLVLTSAPLVSYVRDRVSEINLPLMAGEYTRTRPLSQHSRIRPDMLYDCHPSLVLPIAPHGWHGRDRVGEVDIAQCPPTIGEHTRTPPPYHRSM